MLKTYEKFLTAIATIYKCGASKTSGPLAFLLNEIETVAPGCSELGTRLSLKSSILVEPIKPPIFIKVRLVAHFGIYLQS